MTIIRRFIRPISHLVLLGFVALTLHIPMAQAALVPTGAMVNAGKADAARSQLRATLEREGVKQQLLAQGVSTEQVQARVDSLTDQEAITLAQQMDQLPAGGDAFSVLVLVFLVLLVTDILGWTDIFPFVKKPVR
jgi:hypothetical protein